MRTESIVINVNSPSPEKLIAFYRDVVELENEPEMGEGAFKAGPASFIIDGHSEISANTREPARVLVTMRVNDLAAEHERLKNRGVPVIRTMGKEYWGGIISTFEDPDGNYFQLSEFHPEAAQTA
ncbi:MAG: VOC family protein [Tepidiformaceae bacterium]